MTRPRKIPDGLPFRVFESFGVRVYSIGYKLPGGKWAFKFACPVHDAAEVARTRQKAIVESTKIAAIDPVRPEGGMTGLIDGWFVFQADLPADDGRKRKKSTIDGNKPEAENLKKSFGHLEPHEVTRGMGYDYLQACVRAKRPLKGNKEISLLHLILEYAISLRLIGANPITDLARNTVKRPKRLVTHQELALAVEVGRKLGGPQHIVSMALQMAYLCVRRSVEVRAITRDCITDAGVRWKDGKNDFKADVLIEWTQELRATVNETMAIKRNKLAGSWYLFGNLKGQRYTKGGWKATLAKLMKACTLEAKQRGVPFKQFSLQDCRPMGATAKLDAGDMDTTASLNHTSEKMVQQVYDRRPQKRATGARLVQAGTQK